MAASILQEKVAESTTGSTTISVTLASAVTAGSAIHAVADYGDASALTCTYSDGTNTYTSNLDNTSDGASNNLNQGYALNCAAGTTTVKVTLSGTPSYQGIWAREVGGTVTTAIDNHGAAFVNSSTSPSFALTVNASGALISAIGASLDDGSAITNGAGWTKGSPSGGTVFEDNNGVACSVSESQHFTSSGSKTVLFSDAAGDPDILIAMSFADSGGGPTSVPAVRPLLMPVGGPLLRPGTPFLIRHAQPLPLAAPTALTLALTGQAATFTPGTLAPKNTEAATGTAITSTAGTLKPSHAQALTGSVITSTAGTVKVTHSQALTGTQVATHAGTLLPSHAQALLGIGLVSTAGIFAEKDFEQLVGQRATFNAGTLTATATGSVALTGQAATFAAGTMTASVKVGLTGAAAAYATGHIVPGLALALLGTRAGFTSGLLAPSTKAPLLGTQAVFTSGTITYSAGGGTVTVALTGQAAAFTAGNLTPPAAPSGPAPTLAGGAGVPGWVPDRLEEGLGPYRRPGQRFTDDEVPVVSPFLTSRAEEAARFVPPPIPAVAPPTASAASSGEEEILMLALLMALDELIPPTGALLRSPVDTSGVKR